MPEKIVVQLFFNKKLSANQIAGFFDYPYLYKGLMYAFVFLHVDRHWWNEQSEPINLSTRAQVFPSMTYLGKSGRSTWTKLAFCILVDIGSLDFFDILHKVRSP